ncbi:hypothetical protein [Halorubrum sp. AS12]|uniref:hypothetical protein n=1 Tax=Halorubrum sp. AS12 TaxID=3409687 RepID=UPI003DA7A19D
MVDGVDRVVESEFGGGEDASDRVVAVAEQLRESLDRERGRVGSDLGRCVVAFGFRFAAACRVRLVALAEYRAHIQHSKLMGRIGRRYVADLTMPPELVCDDFTERIFNHLLTRQIHEKRRICREVYRNARGETRRV